jgi:predicted secreted protein
VYQLSLRLGISYQATCHSLRRHEIVNADVAKSLLAVAPKSIKRQILPATYEPANWFPDVWLLTEKDRGTLIEGQPEDLFVLQLRENSGAGYLWDPESLRREGFEIISEERSHIGSSQTVGGSVIHKIATGAAPHAEGAISLSHRRPWEASGVPLEKLTINYDVTGKETGLPRAQRRQLLAA